MMKYFLILMTILGFTCEAQNTFNKRIDLFQSWGDNAWSLQVDSQNIWVVIGTWPNGQLNGRLASALLKLDLNGNVLDVDVYSDPYADVYPGGPQSLNLSNSGFILGGSYEDTSGDSQALLTRIKANGDTAWTGKFGNAGFQSGWMAKQDDDGGFLLCGQTNVGTVPYNNDALFLKTDSMGNIIWQRNYGDILSQELAFAFTKTSDGGYALAGQLLVSNAPDMWLCKLDSLGNLKWDTAIYTPRNQYDQFWNVLSTQDGNILASGYIADSLPNGGTSPYFLKLDLNRNVIWEKQFLWDDFSYVRIFSVRELQDGSFIAVGRHDIPPYPPEKGFLLKLDANGDSLWCREYYIAPNSRHELRDVYPTPDGGFVACGWINPVAPDTGYQDLWILKVDSMGCELANCTVNINELQEKFQALKVFPVPFSSELNVSINPGNEDGELKVFDSTGRLVVEKKITEKEFKLNSASWKDGIYMLYYIAKSGTFTEKIMRVGN